jgi:hypothetical protein
MSVVLTIAGSDKASLINWDSVEREEVLTREPNSLKFLIKKYGTKTYKPTVGDEVILTIGGTREFAGYVVEMSETIEARVEYIEVICKDYTHELDRQLVSKTYESQTVDAIIADLLGTFATGFTDTNVNCPVTIDKVVFNYLPISKCLEKLTDIIGDYEWYVDYYKDIYFFASSSSTATFNLTDTSGNYVFNSLDIREDTHQLRNEVIIRGGLLTSDTVRTEYASGDGTKKIFPLGTKFASLPVVSIGGSSVTVGVANLDTTGYSVYWDYNQKYINFETAVTAGTSNIAVTERYEYPLILQKRSEASISTYGLFQSVIVDKTIKDLDTASLRADVELIRYANPAKSANFKTYTYGLKTGQTINIQSDIRTIDDDFKIQAIRSKLRTPDTGELEHRVEAVTAEDLGINDILSRLLIKNPSDQIDVSQDEFVERIRQLSDSFSIVDSVGTPTSRTGPYAWTGYETAHYALNESSGTSVADTSYNANNATLKINAQGYYPFDGNVNDISVDTSGIARSRNGAITGSVTLTTDRFGNSNGAYNFPGTSSSNKIDIPTSTMQHTGFISMWIRPKGAGVADAGGSYAIFNSILDSRTRLFYVSHATTPGIKFIKGSGSATTSTYTMAINTWYHVVCTWNASTLKAQMYVNGSQVGADITYADTTTAPTNAVIGTMGSASPTPGSFNGDIDEVFVGNVYPSASDITRLYTVGLTHKLNKPFVTGKFSGAYDLWGISAGATGAGGVVIDAGTTVSDIIKDQSNFTLCYWVYCQTTYMGSNSSIGWYGGNFKGPTINLASDRIIRGTIGQGNTTGSNANYSLTTSAVATLNDWNHIALVYDGTNLIVYCNGVSVFTYAIGAFIDNGSGGQKFKINGNPWDYNNVGASKYDDVRVFSKALTVTELATVMAGESVYGESLWGFSTFS